MENISSKIQPQINKVTGTAFIIAAFRHQENASSKPLYEDKVVDIFLNEEIKSKAAPVEKLLPAAVEMIKIRTKYFDEGLAVAIKNGVQQIVILGSGFDTRPERFYQKELNYFEVDAPEILNFKEEVLKDSAYPYQVNFIPGDYTQTNIAELLEQNQCQLDLPTHFIWEGNCMYIPVQKIEVLLKQLQQHFSHFTFAFDYVSKRAVEKRTGSEAASKYVEWFSQIGAPWITGFDQIEPLANQVGLKLKENVTAQVMREKYGRNTGEDSHLYENYSFCTLIKG